MSEMRRELESSARKAFPNWESAHDSDASWRRMTELGWFMAGVPEELGGLALPRSDVATIFLELGRSLVPGAAIAQIAVIEALNSSEPFAERNQLLQAAMSGELLVTSLEQGARQSAIPSADLATYMLVRERERIALFSLADATFKHTQTWDTTRQLFEVTPSSSAKAIVLAIGEDAARISAKVECLICLGLAGDALGGASALLDLTVEYLKTRHQFDRPIAMFQALKHRVADLKCATDTAEALYRELAANEDCGLLALGALKAHCCEVYKRVAEESIQLHGGIGLTVELPVHLFFKRAFINGALGGSSDYWNELAGRAALAQPAV